MSTAINEIQKSSDETAEIIKVIDEIAFQTNLLAGLSKTDRTFHQIANGTDSRKARLRKSPRGQQRKKLFRWMKINRLVRISKSLIADNFQLD